MYFYNEVYSGKKICYQIHGEMENEKIILINGLGAQLIGWSDSFRELLVTRGFCVIAFDNRDCGESFQCEKEDYNLTDMANDCLALCDSLGIDNAHVVGQSMGGMIAQEVAIIAPEFVKSLCLIYTSPDSLTYRIGDEWRKKRNEVPEPKNITEAIENHILFEKACGSMSPYMQDIEKLERVAVEMFARGHHSEGVQRQRLAMERSRPRNNLIKDIHHPTVIIHGKNDQLIDFRASIEMFHAIQNSSLIIIDNLGHEIHAEFELLIAEHIRTNALRC